MLKKFAASLSELGFGGLIGFCRFFAKNPPSNQSTKSTFKKVTIVILY
jgi:hypothetical protein